MAKSGPLERYVRILEVLTAFSDGLTPTEIAKILSLPKTTVGRLLQGLAKSDLVVASRKRGGAVLVGSRLTQVLHSGTRWVEIATERSLKELAGALGETCFIARRFNGEVTSVAMESPDAGVGIYVTPGHELPWHASASGKLLAALADDAIPRTKLTRYTPNTIVEHADIRAELRKIRNQQYALERSEHVAGLATIAVPIPAKNEADVSYAIGLTGSEERVTAKQHVILAQLRAAAQHFAEILSITARGRDEREAATTKFTANAKSSSKTRSQHHRS